MRQTLSWLVIPNGGRRIILNTSVRSFAWSLSKGFRAAFRRPPQSRARLRYPQARSEAAFLQSFLLAETHETLSIDLGCGVQPSNPLRAAKVQGLDLFASPENNVLDCDLFLGVIPLQSESVDVVVARNFIEHVPRAALSDKTRFPFLELMNEIHRVLKPGGCFYSRTPAYPMQEAFQDPTHVNIITEATFPCYFCSELASGGPWAATYGFKGDFTLLSQKWDYCWLMTLMQKT